MSENARLPAGYYLINFETMLREASARYEDLLRPEESQLVDQFLALPLNARRLYVRMLMRKGPWFREDGLSYAEIEDLPKSSEILCHQGFCETEASLTDMVALLKRDEIAEGLERCGIEFPKALRREALLQLWVERTSADALTADLRLRYHFLRPLHEELWELVSFMFFGNSDQDLSDFVLADIGRIHYENYAVDTSARLFQTRHDIDFLRSMRSIREQFEEAKLAGNAESMGLLTDQVLAMEPHPGIRQQRRYHRLLNDVGREWERMEDFGRASRCYALSQLPPARERLARITQDPSRACAMAIQMAAAPLDPSEERFARVFLKRQGKREPEAARWTQSHPEAPPAPILRFALPRQDSVEMAVLEAARELGWAGFFAENLLWNALFGLVFWEELFAPVPGAFVHTFQNAPMDIATPDFFTRREIAIRARLAMIEDHAYLVRRVLETANAKWGVASAFLSWRHLDRAMLQAAVEHVPSPVMASILGTMAVNPRAFSSGFPDLFLYKPGSREWALWEVKGPGDALRPEQERWLRQFRRLGCSVALARVAWVVER
jgi:hypothetical protein